MNVQASKVKPGHPRVGEEGRPREANGIAQDKDIWEDHSGPPTHTRTHMHARAFAHRHKHMYAHTCMHTHLNVHGSLHRHRLVSICQVSQGTA